MQALSNLFGKSYLQSFTQFLVITATGFALFVTAGCGSSGPTTSDRVDIRTTKTSIGGFVMPQSHFTYPNSNVVPLGKARGSSTAAGDNNTFPNISAAIKRAMDQAIASKSGANLLINAVSAGTLTTRMISGTKDGKFFLNVDYQLEMIVEGTAAKMTVGLQNLRQQK